MLVGIVGLPQSGKTTVFNALTRGHARTSALGATRQEAHVGVAKVPDPRLETLSGLLHPLRTVPAEVSYAEFPGATARATRGQLWDGATLNQLARMDALVHVVRSFEDERLPHPEGSVDPDRDMATLDLELTFADLALIERRLQRLEASLKGAKAPEREAAHQEMALLESLKGELEREVPLRQQPLEDEAARLASTYSLLTAKPLLYLLNIGEEQLPAAKAMEEEYGARYSRPGCTLVALCGKLEMELAQLEPEEAQEFRASLGLGEAALDRVVRATYDLLGLVSFFSTASQEVRAWSVPRGISARRAAGKVHSDMERGFVRAEVVAYQDLVGCGSLAEARRHGLLRAEGKDYPLQDGDVITFLFHV